MLHNMHLSKVNDLIYIITCSVPDVLRIPDEDNVDHYTRGNSRTCTSARGIEKEPRTYLLQVRRGTRSWCQVVGDESRGGHRSQDDYAQQRSHALAHEEAFALPEGSGAGVQVHREDLATLTAHPGTEESSVFKSRIINAYLIIIVIFRPI